MSSPTQSPILPEEQSTLNIAGVIFFIVLLTIIFGMFCLQYAQISMDISREVKEKHVRDQMEETIKKRKLEEIEEVNEKKEEKRIRVSVVHEPDYKSGAYKRRNG